MASPMQKRALSAAGVGIVAGLLSAILFGIQPESLAMMHHGTGVPGIGLAAFLLLNALFGALYLLLWGRFTGRGSAVSAMTGLVYGLLWWVLISLVGLPVLLGQGAQWQARAAALAFPALTAFLFQGAGVGLGVLFLLRWLRLADEVQAAASMPAIRHRIVILGGGFAGVTAAQRLERLFGNNEETEILLVSETNYLLFTPMLSEVVGGSVEPQHISTPLRSFFHRVRVVRAPVEQIDLENRRVHLSAGAPSQWSALAYDHLILAMGSVPDFFGNRSIERHAFPFKRLDDPMRLRTHVIERLERADATPDSALRRQMLTFVVAGGGFAGAELAGALNDFVRGALVFYPNVAAEEVCLRLVHSRERLLPELSPELAAFAQRKLEERGVVVTLNGKVIAAGADHVTLSDGETIAADTVIWTAGNQTNPLVAGLDLETDRRGRIRTDETLAVPGQPGLWAVGDCAAIPNRATGETAPPTAQHATRAADLLARNVHASLCGRPRKPFSHRSAGTLAVLGHQTACAELYGVRFAGMLAWWLWRAIYLGKLPTLQKKVRVALDWFVDLFFPRDIVEAGGMAAQGTRPSAQSGIDERSYPVPAQPLASREEVAG